MGRRTAATDAHPRRVRLGLCATHSALPRLFHALGSSGAAASTAR